VRMFVVFSESGVFVRNVFQFAALYKLEDCFVLCWLLPACKSLRAMTPNDYTRMISALSDIHIVREIHFDYG